MITSNSHAPRTPAGSGFPGRLSAVAAAFAKAVGATAYRGVQRLFNLNDNRWGRGLEPQGNEPARSQGSGGGGRNEGPPDLDELWRDFNRKLSGLFGGRGGGSRPGGSGDGGGGGSFQPDMKGAGLGAGLIVGVAVLIWLGSGFFIVQEGHQAVVLSFGKYSYTAEAGFKWRLPYPFQSHEVVPVTQLRSVDIGSSSVVPQTGLRDSSMLTQDENIVDIRFTVQYRLKDVKQYVFENRRPDDAVVQAAESAVREIVGRSLMDSVLYEQRDVIAADLAASIQAQLDRLNAGILISNVNVQSVQPPEQVQAAFDDAFRATADRERAKNEAQAYANEVIPRAQGTASRLREEAEGYRARVIAQAEGDADRFRSVLAEYEKAPAVTRDRLYLETMQQIYANATKVLIDTRNNANLLYLPLDKLLQQSGGAGTGGTAAPATTTPSAGVGEGAPLSSGSDIRSRDNQRSRERETR
ncbi:FtsH protease activity modulator HflK [Caldimonas thermodepolymerans]|jgi:HflK protein|uniref:Protein HflK n=1 Tax=Caldimonas thermodepolymerans TaxID=215580 RepID=A0A2S5T0E6_9BURK|nr:FtsH protease activity modulator HflK [Caldimonas thermodepolymerans]QPC30127.1 FtsH protease activity modulator HflK [Caldimonas thermodepolymerans]RDI00504.1 protease FtsH subunit HflK [Caldimonas thermodepolymerans]TCP07217.1 protease FtsH subunit HflK [Caldimonas thermodepolymerans]